MSLTIAVGRPAAWTCSRQPDVSGRQYSSRSSELLRSSICKPTGYHVLSANTRSTGKAYGALSIQMNLFSRIGRVVKSYTNGLVSAAEDPEKILDQAVSDMQGDLIKMRQGAAQVIASQKQLENKYAQAQSTADEWYRRAELALTKGEEDLAREALQRKKTYQTQADQWKAQMGAQTKAVDQLMANTRLLEQKLQEAKAKKDTLKARAASAKSTKEVNELLSGLSDSSNSYAAFEKMEEKVIAMEAEGEAIGMLGPAGGSGDSLEAKFAMLEGTDTDAELASMKKKIAGGKDAAGELPAGRPLKDAIDMELEELRRKAKEQ
mmetsp:Transcript_38875/g.110012  ORF Transcript_38875/g.110012 Transcript_38875/m.110012 type:complete len:321 (-) Transcript_38875:103-1065(-)|eukprot:CAMPEP_0117653796 /NCGR_PEP_ID=MMETSP0804-20121206/3391_1 /TAXON_ID=1074897 /ORGANISM="Tetraselmis astigmatica, Strain CCMP880" /LENGTH=320 /DNA_ID=CAMNT_0005460013 /DNA_START=349 /DNA_END=1311 /DNA_ORIENTATION=+